MMHIHCEKDHGGRKSKKVKLQSSGDRYDRLGNLPDELLIKILSSMPIRDSILTSRISRRWRHLWKYSLTLEFGLELRHKFIDEVLARHQGMKIENLAAAPRGYIEEEDPQIEKLIRFAVDHHVEKLTLCLLDCVDEGTEDLYEAEILYKLPNCLFLCESLVHLEFWSCQFSPPPLIRLVALESLIISSSKLSDKAILDFTSSCPVIKKLKLDSCNPYADLIITLRSPTLLELEVCNDIPTEGKVEIDAPFLISLKITSNNLKKNYLLKNLSMVTKATLDLEEAVDFSYPTNYGVMNVVEIINSLGHVKHLQLSSLCIMILSSNVIEDGPAPFRCTHLVVSIGLLKPEILGLGYLLKQCSGVEHLTIKLNYEWSGSFMRRVDARLQDSTRLCEKGWWKTIESSCTLLHHLKKIVIFDSPPSIFVERRTELLKILLANLTGLENMTINSADDTLREQSLAGNGLRSFLNVSQNTLITFV